MRLLRVIACASFAALPTHRGRRVLAPFLGRRFAIFGFACGYIGRERLGCLLVILVDLAELHFEGHHIWHGALANDLEMIATRMMPAAAVPAHVCSSIEQQGEECRNGKGEKGPAVYALGSAWPAYAAGYAETT